MTAAVRYAVAAQDAGLAGIVAHLASRRYRLPYILHGPEGSGKSATLAAAAGSLRESAISSGACPPCFCFSLYFFTMTSSSFLLLSQTPPHAQKTQNAGAPLDIVVRFLGSTADSSTPEALLASLIAQAR